MIIITRVKRWKFQVLRFYSMWIIDGIIRWVHMQKNNRSFTQNMYYIYSLIVIPCTQKNMHNFTLKKYRCRFITHAIFIWLSSCWCIEYLIAFYKNSFFLVYWYKIWYQKYDFKPMMLNSYRVYGVYTKHKHSTNYI